jgi:Outer membrane protein beta-barrel domain
MLQQSREGQIMKRILIGLVSALLLVAGSGTAGAEERKGVEAGVRMWINDWTHDVPGVGSITSDTTVLLGPAIEVKFPNHVFVDASYLFSVSDYTFSNNFNTIFNDERQDANLAIGYMIVPEFGVLAGYKNSWFKEKETGIEDTVYGPLIGMIGIAPVYWNAAFYGRLDYLFTRFKQSGGGVGEFREDSPGWTIELGFKFDLTREFNGRIGYRYETNEGSNSNVRDSFSGLILGGMVAF